MSGLKKLLVILCLAVGGWAFVIGGSLLLMQVLTFADIGNTFLEIAAW
jgi:hypothetical protein